MQSEPIDKTPFPSKELSPEDLRKINWISNDCVVKNVLSTEASLLLEHALVLTQDGQEVPVEEHPPWACHATGHLKMVLYRVLVDLMMYGVSVIGLVGTCSSDLGFKNFPLSAFSVRVKPNLSFEKLTSARCEYELRALYKTTVDTNRLTVVEHPLFGPTIFGELQSPLFSLLQAFNTFKAREKAEFCKQQLSSSMHLVFERDHQQPTESKDLDQNEVEWNKVLLARRHDVRLVSQPHDSIEGIVHHIAPMDTSFKEVLVPGLTKDNDRFKKRPEPSADQLWENKVRLVLAGVLDACTIQLLENLSQELLTTFNEEHDMRWGVVFRPSLKPRKARSTKKRKKRP